MKKLGITLLSAVIAASTVSCGGGSGGGSSNGGSNNGENSALIVVSPANFSLSTDDSSQTITVSNTGTATASNLTLPTLNSPLSRSSTTCNTTLAAESSCTYTVLVDYTQNQNTLAGNEAISFSYNNGQQAQTANATASWSASNGGSSPTSLTITPTSFSLNVDDSSQTITISNNGSSTVSNLILPTLSAPLSLSSTNCGSSLAVGSSCIYTVLADYTSQTIAAGSQQLTFGYNDGQQRTADVNAGWAANTASITINPSFISLSEAVPSQTITVSNTSKVVATNLVLPTLNTPLSQSTPTTCTNSLAGNSSCTYTVSINYTGQTIAVGDQQLAFSYNDGHENVAASWSASNSTPTPVPPSGNYYQIYTNMAPIVSGSDNGFCATINGTNQVTITPLNDGTGNSQLCDSTGFCTVLQQAGATCGQVAWSSTGVGAGAHVINYLNCNLSDNRTVLTAEARLENSGNPTFTCTGNVMLTPQ